MRLLDRSVGCARRFMFGAALTLPIGLVPAGQAIAAAMPAPWTSYLGANDREVDWGRTVRDIGRKVLGVYLGKDPAAVQAAFSGRPYQNFVGRLRDACDRGYSVILDVGGISSGRDPSNIKNYFAMLGKQEGHDWREIVKLQAARVLQDAPRGCKIIWELGNEINSQFFSENVLPEAGAGSRAKQDQNDPDVMGVYVEEVLAPAADALREVRSSSPGAEGRMYILLGTIANAFNPKSREWMEQLLDYQVQGRFGKIAAGKRVYEIADVVGIHYLISRDETDWNQALTRLYDRWVRSGKLHGLWQTEEIGAQYNKGGQGGAVALRNLGRYLHWASGEQVTPEQSRMLSWVPWSKDAPADADTALTTLHAFIGDPRLQEVRLDGAPGEAYAFAAAEGSPAGFAIVAGPTRGSVDRLGFGEANAGAGQVACYRAARGAVTKVGCTADRSGIKLDGSVALGQDEALLAMFKRG